MRSIIIAAALIAAAGAVYAMGQGQGQGQDEARRNKAGPAAPASCLLVDVGSKLLVNTGSCLRVQ